MRFLCLAEQKCLFAIIAPLYSDAARDRGALRSSGAAYMVYPAWVSLFFFLRDFLRKFRTDRSEILPQCVDWAEGDNKEFHRDSFCSF